jgi:molybdate transport system substrate-binding protein
VPIGQYTVHVLDRASREPGYGIDFRARVLRNVVSREDNVRQIVSKVVLGEADAAVVYATDATPAMRDALQVIPIPDQLSPLTSYPIAVAHGDNPAGGQAFVSYVLSPAGQHILARWGFLPAAAP